jgi:hypothetical protein
MQVIYVVDQTKNWFFVATTRQQHKITWKDISADGSLDCAKTNRPDEIKGNA